MAKMSKVTISENPMQDVLQVPAFDIPIYRRKLAEKNKCDKNIAFVTYGGIGDVLCCEPTIRYSCEFIAPRAKWEKITVITRFPDIFKHLPVDIVQVSPEGKIEIDNALETYHFLYCGHPETNLQHCFFTHNSMLAVDYPALSSIRMQLPLRYRTIWSEPAETGLKLSKKAVHIHAGAHWRSKRFPRTWWNPIIKEMVSRGLEPILIGGPPSKDDIHPGTVNIDPEGCLDLRGKLKISESAEHLYKANVLITNDSFPLHLATIGRAHIGFFATAKDPEWLYHFRKNESGDIVFGWRMQDLALGGAYQRAFTDRNATSAISEATYKELMSWLPEPKSVVDWVEERLEML